MADVEPDFFSDPAVLADPKSYFDRLRSRCPVMKENYHGSLMVTGYDEVMAVLNRRDDVFSSVAGREGWCRVSVFRLLLRNRSIETLSGLNRIRNPASETGITG